MASQERFLSAAVSKLSLSADYPAKRPPLTVSKDGLLNRPVVTETDYDSGGEEQDFTLQPPQSSHDRDNVGLLSSAAILATQHQTATEMENTFADGSQMFLSPVGSMEEIPSDNFDTELYDFLQEPLHLGTIELW